MRTLLVRWAVIVIAVFLVAWGLPQVLPGSSPIIRYDDWATLAIFAAVLALLNTFIRPILGFLSIPINCLTAGLFGIVLNALMFSLAAYIVSAIGGGFYVADFWAALIGAIAVSVVSVVINMVTAPIR